MPNSSVLQSVISPRPPTTSAVIPFAATEEPTAEDRINDIPDLELITSALVENAPVAMAMLDRKMRYVLANRQWIADFGLKDALPLLGRSQFDVFPNLNPGWKNVYERALQGHVVRSEHDVQPAHPGARPIVFRWEVRPWRRTVDAAVMGIMLTCEKFSGVSLPLSENETATEPAPSAAGALSKAQLPECGVPMVALDASGHVQDCNSAMRALLSTAAAEGSLPVWETLAGCVATEEARAQWMNSLANVTAGHVATMTLEPRLFTGPSALLQWTLSQFIRPGAETLVLLMGNATPFAVAAEPAPISEVPPPLPSPDFPSAPVKSDFFSPKPAPAEDNLVRELDRMHEVEATYQRREQRQREILDTMPCGLIVLDERGRPIFQNAHVRDLVGRELQTGGSVEQWIVSACPDEAGREQAATVWRDDIWRRQITRVLSLITADGLVKDLEFRPCSLPQGGLLLTVHDVTDTCRLEEMLAGVEAKFRTMMRDCPLPLLLTDVKGAIFDTNSEAEALFSRSRNELRRLSLDSLLSAESEERRRAEVARVAGSGLSQARISVHLQAPAAQAGEHELCVAVVKGGEGRPHALVNFLKPIHSAPAAQPIAAPVSTPALPVATEVQSSWETVLTTDEFGRIDSWNEALGLAHFGLSESQAVGTHLHRLFRPSDATGFYNSLQQHLAVMAEGPVHWSWFGGEAKRGEDDFLVLAREPGTFALELRLQTNPPPHLGALAEPLFADLSPAAPAAADSPQTRPSQVYVIAPGPAELWSGGDLNRERMLLTETHHRVKNHLQIISSLLNLQSNSVEDEAVRSLLRSSQNRVRAIAALHQHLYEMQLGQALCLTDFAKELVVRLRECFEAPEDRVKVELNLKSPRLHDEWLMPVALILNEALSNAFKHAFPDGRKGTIRVSLSVESDGAHLRVEDDGVGLPENFGGPGSMGLGLKVLGVFADQLRGQTSLKNIVNVGLRFDLLFPITCVDI